MKTTTVLSAALLLAATPALAGKTPSPGVSSAAQFAPSSAVRSAGSAPAIAVLSKSFSDIAVTGAGSSRILSMTMPSGKVITAKLVGKNTAAVTHDGKTSTFTID